MARNPLLGIQRSQSKRAPDHAPYADKGELDPVPEEFGGGEVFAYRGTETHGVKPTDHFAPTEDFDATTEIEYEAEAEPPTPIPVRIVTGEKGRELWNFRVGQMIVPDGQTGAAARIVGAHPDRRALRLRNIGAVTIWISHLANLATKQDGYPIPAGTEATFTHRMDVFGVSDDGTPQRVAFLAEYNQSE